MLRRSSNYRGGIVQRRELSDSDVMLQAEACRDYLRKAGNKGASFWVASKGFKPADRRAVLLALGEI